MKTYRIAVIPGDGIGKEVVPEGIRVLEAIGKKFGIAFKWEEFPWSCEYRAKQGRMMPENGLATIRHHDAIFFGACGFPGVPDHLSLWELLIPMRRQFDLYVNLRPVRLMPGIKSPLASRNVGDIDFVVVRENTEGEYSSIGGRIFEGVLRLRSIHFSEPVDERVAHVFLTFATNQINHIFREMSILLI